MNFHSCRLHLFAHLFFIYIFLFDIASGKQKEPDVPDFIATEIKALESSARCPIQQLTKYYVKSLWLKEQSSDTTVLCVLKFLDINRGDDTGWSILGTLFEQKNLKQQADYCFKQAVKIMGKHTQFIRAWSFIGPFVIGKTEFDGDALAAYGGIQNISRFRFDSKPPATLFSRG